MKLHSGGTSTTLTSIARRSASSNTRMLTSVSSVAAIAIRQPSRSPDSYSRRSQRIDPSSGQLAQRRVRVGRDQRHVGVAGQQPLDLLQADVAAAHDQAPAALQPQAGDVERRLEHVAHAATGRRSPCGAGRRTPCRRRPVRAWRKRSRGGSRPVRLGAMRAPRAGVPCPRSCSGYPGERQQRLGKGAVGACASGSDMSMRDRGRRPVVRTISVCRVGLSLRACRKGPLSTLGPGVLGDFASGGEDRSPTTVWAALICERR